MAFFKRKENRAVSAGRDSSVMDLLSSEEVATREQALQIPTIQACINKIADSVSMLPVKLYRKEDGKPVEVTDDNRVKLLNGETGDTLNTVEMWKALLADYYVGHGGWAFIHTNGGKAFSIHYVDSRQIGLNTNADPIFKAYSVNVGGQEYFDFKFIKLLRKTIDGYTNIPVQEENSRIISAAYNALKLEIKMSKSGGTKGGFLKSKNKLSREIMEDIRRGYENLYDSFNDSGNRKILILNDGMDFQEVSATAVEMQINENKKANAVEICKIFGFPHSILDGGASEEDRRQYIQTVTALLNQIETELDSKLLLESEKESGYYWAFDTKELTRGSQKERYEAYAVGLKNHFLQVDEVRKEEDYEPMGFNFFTLGLGDVLYNPVTKEVFTPNTGQMTTLSEEMRAYNPNQPRESNGRFASTGGSSGGGSSKKIVDKSGESGIIKSIEVAKSLEVDDFEMMGTAGDNNIDPEVLNSISKVVNKYEKEGKMYINDFSFEDLTPKVEDGVNGTPIMQIEPYGNKQIRLKVNKVWFDGKSLSEVDSLIGASDLSVAKNLEEATIHECGHAMSIKGKTVVEANAFYKKLAGKGVSGISKIASQDGAEALAEIEVLKSRGTKLSDEAKSFYNEHMR